MGDRKYKILDMLNLLAHNSDFVKIMQMIMK